MREPHGHMILKSTEGDQHSIQKTSLNISTFQNFVSTHVSCVSSIWILSETQIQFFFSMMAQKKTTEMFELDLKELRL